MDRAAQDCSSSAAAPTQRAAGGAPAETTHGAAVVGSDAELLDVALPFLEEGLQQDDLVVLTCPPETVAVICAALGPRADGVEDEPALSLLGSRAPDAFSLCNRYLERAKAGGSGRLRVLAGIDFGSHPADWREGQRFESVTNRLLRGTPVTVLCVYDRRRLAPQVIEAASATHPELVVGGNWVPSARFQDPTAYIPTLPVPRETVENGSPVLTIEDAPTLVALRRQLCAVLAARVPDREQREDLQLGASEIAANAFRHGVRPVSAKIWTDGDRLICTITDRGTTYADPFSGFAPAHGPDLGRGGMGMWLARKLWDHVDLLPGPAGLTVRLSTRLR